MRSKVKVSRNKQGLLEALFFFLPAYLLLGVLWIYPMAYAVYLSFFNQDLMRPYQFDFVGLRNYLTFLTSDPNTATVLWATLAITGLAVIGSFAVGLATAAIMEKKKSRLIRALVIYPYAVPTVVVSLLTLWITNPTFGILTYAIYLVTGSRVDLLVQPTTALLTDVAAFVWKYYPFSTLILLAALEGVPVELSEAASLDGASPLQRYIYVTLPSIRKTVSVLGILLIIFGFQCFDILYMVTYGGPALSTTNMVLYVYQTAFYSLKMSYGSTVGVFSTLGMMVLTIVYLRTMQE